jgi:hypothetical protein
MKNVVHTIRIKQLDGPTQTIVGRYAWKGELLRVEAADAWISALYKHSDTECNAKAFKAIDAETGVSFWLIYATKDIEPETEIVLK